MKVGIRKKVVILGCGNLAWHLAGQFFLLKNFEIHIYNHKLNKALSDFRKHFKAITHPEFSNIIKDADYYFICVSDNFISSASEIIKCKDSAIVAHTSGSVSIRKLDKSIVNKVVFYPLQTFSSGVNINWKEVPIFIEASNENALRKINALARLFSKEVYQLSSSERLKFHLAAVIVNNFTNALYVEADKFLAAQKSKLNFKMLLPLIEQTSLKLKTLSPLQAQTGPAKRNDEKVIRKHLEVIESKHLKKIYKLMSASIQRQQK